MRRDARWLAVGLLVVGWLGTSAASAQEAWQPRKPNVVFILCDDLGIGDVQALNPTRGKIPTPNMDKLVSQGMSFHDAHSTSAVCSPSRYSILTGRYNWRSHLQKGVLQGSSAPLIEKGRMTVAELLRSEGYSTQMFGKWHLGLTFGADKFKDPIVDGPLQHGFDHYFGISASLDMPPFAFIDDNRFPEEPTATKKWVREGPAAPSFEAEDVLPKLSEHAVSYLKSQAGAAKPFFLYLALTSPHTPILPTKQWQGKSGIGSYGDFVMETDWVVGEVTKALDEAKLSDSTLLVFTSDNGCSPAAKTEELERKGHFASAEYRGYKADIWEGGHHIPFIVRWPGVVAPGSRSDVTACQVDFIATCADVTGAKLPDNAAEDSVSLLPVLRGTQQGPLREAYVHHSIDGNFAVRQGKWKLELCAGSGGWGAPREPAAHQQGLPKVQLYDLESDVAEKNNVYAEHPDVVEKLTALLQKYIDEGRTTPGAPQKNDVRIDLWKIPKAGATTKPANDNG